MCPASDVKDVRAAKTRHKCALLLAETAVDLRFHDGQFAAQPFTFAFGLLPRTFGLRHRQACRLEAAFETLATRGLPIEPSVDIDQRGLSSAGVIVGVLRRRRSPGQRPAEGLVKQPNLSVALDEAIAQLALLLFELGRQNRVLPLQ